MSKVPMTVRGHELLQAEVKKLKSEENLDLVVSMGSVAASGGYYISMAVGDQENSIYAEPSTITGSIGVYAGHLNMDEFWSDRLGVTFGRVDFGRLFKDYYGPLVIAGFVVGHA